jgi:hypothetical protein
MSEKKKVGIAIDPWKLSIFERHLTQSGYTVENAGLLHKDAHLLRVDTTNVEALGHVVGAANAEAAKTGAPK